MAQIIKRGILQSFDPTTYTASVLLIEATSAFLTGVPISTSIDVSSAVANAYCAVLFFDEHNHTDAVIIAVYPNGSVGVPNPAPGRVVFVAASAFLGGVVINNGVTNTYTITGVGGIPSKAKGIIYDAAVSSPTLAAYISIAPKGLAGLATYDVIQVPVINQFIRFSSVLQVDANGQIDILAGTGNCTVYIFTRGYVI